MVEILGSHSGGYEDFFFLEYIAVWSVKNLRFNGFHGVITQRIELLSMAQSFLFVLHHRETLCTGVLNGLKKQEVSDKCEKGRKRGASVRKGEGNKKMSEKTCATFGTTDWSLDQHSVRNLSR
jgi:hypothetical protein